MTTAFDEELSDLLYDGQMVLAEPSGRQRKRSINATQVPSASQLPTVKIGYPRTQIINKLVLNTDLLAEAKASLKDNIFFIVQLACMFYPHSKDVNIAWAQLVLQLKPDGKGIIPLAFDLYPKSVELERQARKRISLNPNLKFKEVEAERGEPNYSINYPAIEPQLSATGIGEPTPRWNFTAIPEFPLIGEKFLYAIIAAPRALSGLIANVTLAADLDYGKKRFSAWPRGKPDEARPGILDIKLWP